MFVLIYFQKFAIGGSSTQIGVPLLVFLPSLAFLFIRGHNILSSDRLILYLVFLVTTLVSQILTTGEISITSLMLLLTLYLCLTIKFVVTEDDYFRILNAFVKLMIVPSCIIIFQFVYQKVTNQTNPLNMNNIVPEPLLMRGFMYEAPYKWGQSFVRPNGFFFLETSYASMFAAAAAIIEATYFRRPYVFALMLLAVALTIGGTGVLMIIVAAPFLLMRESRSVIIISLLLGCAGLFALTMIDMDLPLLSRAQELGRQGSSGSERLVVPAMELISLLSDPNYLFTGSGAGSITLSFGNAWPLTKLVYEYGILTSIAFMALFIFGLIGKYNVPLKVSLAFVFLFTGGYLLNLVMCELLVLVCYALVPVQRAGMYSEPKRAPEHPAASRALAPRLAPRVVDG